MLDHTDRNAAIMRRIRDLGMHISLDDFGSGYSSLTYLRLLPIDSIKIDRSFLQSLVTAELDAPLVGAFEAGDHPQAGRLAGAGRTQQREELPAADVEIDTVDGHDVAVQLAHSGEPDVRD